MLCEDNGEPENVEQPANPPSMKMVKNRIFSKQVVLNGPELMYLLLTITFLIQQVLCTSIQKSSLFIDYIYLLL